jgi:uncharacterized membrane protein
MAVETPGTWLKLKKNVGRGLASGMLVLVPVGVTLLVMRWLFSWVAGLLRPVVRSVTSRLELLHWIQALPDAYVNVCVSVLALLLLLVLLYLVGVLGQHIIGRRLLGALDKVWLKIPLARSVYAATKQVMETLSQPQGGAFKSVVLVEFPGPGLRAVGFLTGYVHDATGRRYAKVLIPTTPNPTTGFLELVPEEKVTMTDLEFEDAFKMIISGGIISSGDLFKPRQELAPGNAPEGTE